MRQSTCGVSALMLFANSCTLVGLLMSSCVTSTIGVGATQGGAGRGVSCAGGLALQAAPQQQMLAAPAVANRGSRSSCSPAPPWSLRSSSACAGCRAVAMTRLPRARSCFTNCKCLVVEERNGSQYQWTGTGTAPAQPHSCASFPTSRPMPRLAPVTTTVRPPLERPRGAIMFSESLLSGAPTDELWRGGVDSAESMPATMHHLKRVLALTDASSGSAAGRRYAQKSTTSPER